MALAQLCHANHILENSMKHCPTCKVVNFVCFWGDKPQKEWKRPILFVLSLLVLIGGSYLFYISEHPSSKDPFTIILAIIIATLFMFCIAVSVLGCNRCVARLFGDI